MASQDEQVAAAIEAERQRCVEIIEIYQRDFEDSPLHSVWFRMRNHVAAGDDFGKIRFAEQAEKTPKK